MDPLGAIPPIQAGQPTPAPIARVARVERNEQHQTPDEERSPGRQRDEQAPEEEDLEDFYDEGWTERFATRAEPKDEQRSGPHIDISA